MALVTLFERLRAIVFCGVVYIFICAFAEFSAVFRDGVEFIATTARSRTGVLYGHSTMMW